MLSPRRRNALTETKSLPNEGILCEIARNIEVNDVVIFTLPRISLRRMSRVASCSARFRSVADANALCFSTPASGMVLYSPQQVALAEARTLWETYTFAVIIIMLIALQFPAISPRNLGMVSFSDSCHLIFIPACLIGHVVASVARDVPYFRRRA